MTKTYDGGGLPELLGMTVSDQGEDWLEMVMPIHTGHFRPGIAGLHAGSVVSLADTACGKGCLAALPQTASGFVTLELKSNLIGTATDGTLVCRAHAEHKGRTTQIWTAQVEHKETGRKIAKFSCTQLIMY